MSEAILKAAPRTFAVLKPAFRTRSIGEDTLAAQLAMLKMPKPHREYRFAPPRLWRFDFAWPEQKLAVEVEGGTWTNGRHSRGKGFAADCEKYNRAALDGWTVLRFPTERVKDGTAISTIQRKLGE